MNIYECRYTFWSSRQILTVNNRNFNANGIYTENYCSHIKKSGLSNNFDSLQHMVNSQKLSNVYLINIISFYFFSI